MNSPTTLTILFVSLAYGFIPDPSPPSLYQTHHPPISTRSLPTTTRLHSSSSESSEPLSSSKPSSLSPITTTSTTTTTMGFGSIIALAFGPPPPTTAMNGFQRALLAAAALPFLSHQEPLPLPARRLVSNRARIVLRFFVEYLRFVRDNSDPNDDRAVSVDLYASGGYVRDLLLGRIAPDLDLSLGLGGCSPDITVESVLKDLPEFVTNRPDLAVRCAEVGSTAKSSGAVSKGMDAVQVRLELVGLGEGVVEEEGGEMGEAIFVDVLPTIGREEYNSEDRVPDRDARGTAEEDSLRRDLTVGSMLLHVTTTTEMEDEMEGEREGLGLLNRRRRRRKQLSRRFPSVPNLSGRNGGGFGTSSTDCILSSAIRDASSTLKLVLLDYHNGVEDLSTRTLSCPTPNSATLHDVWNTVIVSPYDEALASSIGLLPPPTPDATNTTLPPSPNDKTQIRALWWAKMLRDDPYRLLRTLRFSVTLGFAIDPCFYVAAPFALYSQTGVGSSFREKVSCTRKVDELRKVSKACGVPGLMRFLDLVTRPWVVGGSALRDAFFDARELSGGGDSGGRYLGVMDWERVKRLTPRLPKGLSVDERVGVALLVACFGMERGNSASVESTVMDGAKTTEERNLFDVIRRTDAGVGPSVVATATKLRENGTKNECDIDDEYCEGSACLVSRLERTQKIVEAACDGLRTPNSIRKAAIDPIYNAQRMLEPLSVQNADAILARAVPWPSLPSEPTSTEDRARQFALLVRAWDVLKLDPRSTRARRSGSIDGSSSSPPPPDPLWTMGLVNAAARDCDGGGGGRGSPSDVSRRLEFDLALLLPLCESGREGDAGGAGGETSPSVVGPQPLEGARIGGAVAGLPEVPLHLRGWMMTAVHVLTRLRGDAPFVETADQLREYLEIDCDGLLTELAEEWWVEAEKGRRSESIEKGADMEDGNRAFVGVKLRSPYVKR